MGKLEKGFRLLNETELNDIHGGRRASGAEKSCATCQDCKNEGITWTTGWRSNAEVEQAMAAHTSETGHTNFFVEGCVRNNE